MALHHRDGHLSRRTGLLARLDQSPEDVAVLGVCLITSTNAAGDGGQAVADLLHRPNREVTSGWIGEPRHRWRRSGEVEGIGLARFPCGEGRLDLGHGIAVARLVNDLGLAGWLAGPLVEVHAAGEPHQPARVAAAAVGLAVGDQPRRERPPGGWVNRLRKRPVGVHRLPAGQRHRRGLWQRQGLPGNHLIGDRDVVPLHKQAVAGGDVVINHAAGGLALLVAPAVGAGVAGDQVDRPTSGTVGSQLGRVEAVEICGPPLPARITAADVGALVGGERAKPGSGRVDAKQLQEVLSINRIKKHEYLLR